MRTHKNHPLLSKILLVLLTSCILVAYILLTNPNTVALPLLLIPFVLIGFILYEITSLIIRTINRESQNLILRMLPAGVGFVGVTLMVLSSLHQLTWKDTLLVILFAGLFGLYLWRADFLRKNS